MSPTPQARLRRSSCLGRQAGVSAPPRVTQIKGLSDLAERVPLAAARPKRQRRGRPVSTAVPASNQTRALVGITFVVATLPPPSADAGSRSKERRLPTVVKP